MQKYLSKQLGSCCHLTLSNKIFKTNTSPYLMNNIPQKQVISFTKKPQKKSLRRVGSGRVLDVRNNNFKYAPKIIKKEIQIGVYQQQQIDDQGNKKNVQKTRQNLRLSLKKIVLSPLDVRQKLYRFLQRQPVRIQPSKRNLIHELKNYQNHTKHHLMLPPKLQPSNPTSYNRPIPPNTFPQPHAVPNTINPHKPPIILYQSPILDHSVLSNSISSNPFNPFGNGFRVPYQNQRIFRVFPAGHPAIVISRPTLIGPGSNNYADSFRQVYGEIDMEEEIKKDIIKSVQFRRQYHNQSRVNGLSLLNKSPQSETSTMIPSEIRLRKNINQTDSSDAFNYSRHIRTEQKYRLQRQNLFVGSSQSKTKYRRKKFKSIVSVDSEHNSSQSEDSVIIDKHPRQIVSTRPIKTLF